MAATKLETARNQRFGGHSARLTKVPYIRGMGSRLRQRAQAPAPAAHAPGECFEAKTGTKLILALDREARQTPGEMTDPGCEGISHAWRSLEMGGKRWPSVLSPAAH
jgi:hypothetical protein